MNFLNPGQLVTKKERKNWAGKAISTNHDGKDKVWQRWPSWQEPGKWSQCHDMFGPGTLPPRLPG